MGPRSRTRPSLPLPTLHALQLRRPINLHHAIDLAVRMRMVLARVYLLTIHVHSRNAKEAVFGARDGDFAAAVSVAVELGFGDPAFLEALEDVGAEVFVVWGTRAVFGVEALLQIFSWCSA